jgi:hypothetical protein
MKVKLTYFKNSGKYYTSGEYETKQKELFDIWDEVEEMIKHPGLIGKWNEGPILINVPDHSHNHPRLVWNK